VNHAAPNSNQLQLNSIGTTFPVMWIANAGEDTLSKIDTNLNKEIARYRTGFGPTGQAGFAGHLGNAYAGAAPSRTAVDINGNAYVLNRHFDGKSAVLIKILAERTAQRNGVIDTSSDLDNNGLITGAEIKPLGDTNASGYIDAAELQDERVAWAVRVPDGVTAPHVLGQLGRSLCIAPDGNLWVGLFNNAGITRCLANGATLGGPYTFPTTPYGCLVDAQGILWSADLGSQLGRLDTNNPTNVAAFPFSMSNYGIAIGNDRVYLATYGGANGKPFARFNPATNTFDTPAGSNHGALGIAVDGSGNVIAGNYSSGGVTKFDPNGVVLWSRPNQAGTGEVRGVAIDANNDVWLIHRPRPTSPSSVARTARRWVCSRSATSRTPTATPPASRSATPRTAPAPGPRCWTVPATGWRGEPSTGTTWFPRAAACRCRRVPPTPWPACPWCLTRRSPRTSRSMPAAVSSRSRPA
jgi:streptogramin lyase